MSGTFTFLFEKEKRVFFFFFLEKTILRPNNNNNNSILAYCFFLSLTASVELPETIAINLGRIFYVVLLLYISNDVLSGNVSLRHRSVTTGEK